MIPKDEQNGRNGGNLNLMVGKYVDVRKWRTGTRRGVIEAVMKDKSGFWQNALGAGPDGPPLP